MHTQWMHNRNGRQQMDVSGQVDSITVELRDGFTPTPPEEVRFITERSILTEGVHLILSAHDVNGRRVNVFIDGEQWAKKLLHELRDIVVHDIEASPHQREVDPEDYREMDWDLDPDNVAQLEGDPF